MLIMVRLPAPELTNVTGSHAVESLFEPALHSRILYLGIVCRARRVGRSLADEHQSVQKRRLRFWAGAVDSSVYELSSAGLVVPKEVCPQSEIGVRMLPTPDDVARAPAWENYVTAQVVQASLGQIPANALAVGVRVDGRQAELVFYLSNMTGGDAEDMESLTSEFEALVGEQIRVTRCVEIRSGLSVDPRDGIRWVYLARPDATLENGSE